MCLMKNKRSREQSVIASEMMQRNSGRRSCWVGWRRRWAYVFVCVCVCVWGLRGVLGDGVSV